MVIFYSPLENFYAGGGDCMLKFMSEFHAYCKPQSSPVIDNKPITRGANALMRDLSIKEPELKKYAAKGKHCCSINKN